MDLRAQMDGIYRDTSPDRIPWNIETPPESLVELVESGWVEPCDAIDLGCGAGNYAVWLASRGFRMTGVDLSAVAIDMARRLARERGVRCEWRAADWTAPDTAEEFAGAFAFAYDWEVLHHVFPDRRPAFVANVHRVLKPGGRYLSACFSEQDRTFEGEGHYRRTRIGTELYFSSEPEMRALFEPFFTIDGLETLQVPGKNGAVHSVIRTRMTRGA